MAFAEDGDTRTSQVPIITPYTLSIVYLTNYSYLIYYVASFSWEAIRVEVKRCIKSDICFCVQS